MLRALIGITLVLLSSGVPAGAGPVTLLSRTDPARPSGTAGGMSETAGISADGRYVLLYSNADNLLPGMTDANVGRNLFLHDRVAGTTVLVNHAAGNPSKTADAEVTNAVLSADGRWAAFASRATNLVAGQVEGGSQPWSAASDIFLWDRGSGVVRLVSHQPGLPATADGGCWDSKGLGISADGNRVVFGSSAPDLMAGETDSNSSIDIFLYDRATDTNTLVSTVANDVFFAAGGSLDSVISADGNWVAFLSTATNLVAGQTDGNGGSDLLLYSRATGTNVLVSHAAGAASTAANASTGDTASWVPQLSISADGSRIAYWSNASNLVAGQVDGNAGADVFLYDRATGTNTLASHSSAGATTAGNGVCRGPQVSADGRYVAYVSASSDLVAGDTNVYEDVFVYDRVAGTNLLVSRRDAGTPADSYSYSPRISSDGSWIGFESWAGNLVSGQTGGSSINVNAFLWSRSSGTITLVSRRPGTVATAASGGVLQMSADASWIALESWLALADGIADLNGASDVFLYERATGVNTLLTARGGAVSVSAGGGFVFGPTTGAVVSNDGRYVAFASVAPNLPGDTVDGDASLDVFLSDRVTGTVKLVSHASGSPTTAGDADSFSPVISTDGSVVVFHSVASNLVSSPGSPFYFSWGQLYLYDRATGGITLISHSAGDPSDPGPGMAETDGYAVSGDGRWIAFVDTANVGLVAGQVPGGNYFNDNVFLFDRSTGVNTLVSHASSSPLQTGDAASGSPSISADGRYIAYVSNASDLVPGQAGAGGVFLFDQVTGTTTRVSGLDGSVVVTSGDTAPVVSADGRWVLFASSAPDVVPGQTDTNDALDVFLWDRISGSTVLVSRTPGSPTTAGDAKSSVTGQTDQEASPPALSADGRWAIFSSQATNLVSGETGAIGFGGGIYLFDRMTGTVALVSRSAASPTDMRLASDPAISADGHFVSFLSWSGDLVPGQVSQGFAPNCYLYDRTAGTTALVSHIPTSETTTSAFSLPTQGWARVSADGAWVAFDSTAPDLAAGDHDGTWDAFLYANPLPGRDFFTVTPCRIFDSRQAGQGPALASGLRRIILAGGVCGIPATARAVAVNLTVTQPSAAGYLTLHAGDMAPDGTSALTFTAGQTRANNAIAPLAFNGTGTFAVTPLVGGNGTVHVTIDVSGYFE
jgi:Tol biopolymer transport system component